MRDIGHPCHPCHPPVVHHTVVCRHQVEVEVLPAAAEVFFADERYTNPWDTQIRFKAVVYNAPTSDVTWEVTDLGGGPGAGSIDTSGLYTAPPKGALTHGHTDIVVATAAADPMRRAYAFVTLVGLGPEPEPDPTLEIFPHTATLYYHQGHDNQYIDTSNKSHRFRALLKYTPLTGVEWSINGGSWTPDGLYFFYQTPNSGSSPATATVRARLTGDSSVQDEVEITLLNYEWPGIKP